MNDRLQSLLAAERADAADSDDDAFAERVVGRLRDAAVVGAGVAIATGSTSASATTTAATSSTIGIVKAMAVLGAVTAISVGTVVVVGARPRDEVKSVEQAAAVIVVDEAVADREEIAVVEPVIVAEPVAAVVEVSTRRRVTLPISPVPASPSSPSELERYDVAAAALRAGRVDDAATLFAALLVAHPHGTLRPETQVSLLESLFRAGRFAEVVAAVPAAVVDVDGVRRADVRRLEGDALVKLGRCDDARVAYDTALRGQARLSVDDVTAALAACSTR